jgi:hypothetical protein
MGEKKTKKLIKPRKPGKKPIIQIKILKNRPVRFRFYKQKTEKIEPNPNWKNQAKSVWIDFCPKNRTEPKPVGLNQFRFGFGFFKKILFGYFFL